VFASVWGVQRSFDDPATPLHEVTFCVVDVETTGASPAGDAITEIGAARFRGGERLGTFQTLVNPGAPIAPEVAVLTGITEAMLLPAPTIDDVLPSLLEFVGGAVLVGHNLRFDMAFFDAALAATGRDRLGQRRVDTVALARRLVRDDVLDCRLGTLAARFGLSHEPCHRALDDALATADLLHLLLERAAAFGVVGLDDLLALPAQAKHRQAAKLRLTARLPRATGVYAFRDREGRVLRVGTASDVRARVRSHFAGSDRGVVGSLLRETRTIDHVRCSSSLAAAVLKVRVVQSCSPRFNRAARPSGHRYVALTGGSEPRLVVTKAVRPPGHVAWLGPLPSTAAARQVVEAITAVCGARDPAVSLALSGSPTALLSRFATRRDALLDESRHAAAALVRSGAEAVTQALRRTRQVDVLRRAGRVVLELPDGSGAELLRGCLLRAWPAPPSSSAPPPRVRRASAESAELAAWLSPDRCSPPPADGPVPPTVMDEMVCVATWLERWAHRVRLVSADGELAEPLPRLAMPAPAPAPVPAPGAPHPPSRHDHDSTQIEAVSAGPDSTVYRSRVPCPSESGTPAQ
jgi:DNA polymerase-3 subunit epsilon